jgi:hypothetical protein
LEKDEERLKSKKFFGLFWMRRCYRNIKKLKQL